MLVKVVFAVFVTLAYSWDAGCPKALPPANYQTCECNANPTAAKFAACNSLNQPLYFNTNEDIPNGVCLSYVNGKKQGISLSTCMVDSDCMEELHCRNGLCTDVNGKIEQNRLVQICVSPKHYSTNKDMAGCGYSDRDNIYRCHQWWITREGMKWRQYIQYNPEGFGDAYCWAYDEAVCAVGGNQMDYSQSYPWCKNVETSKEGIDTFGNVIDSSCPCVTKNHIAPLGNVAFSQVGWGHHMYIHVYDLMYPGYKFEGQTRSFRPDKLQEPASEQDQFYLKIVNQYADEILVYLEGPVARYLEHVSGTIPHAWEGWNGPTRTLRGKEGFYNGANDPWVQRIKIAPNADPSYKTQPVARARSDGTPIGAFYLPPDHHLSLFIADKSNGGWFVPDGSCPNVACNRAGRSLWFTRGDAYNYPDRDPLLLVEPNVNDFNINVPSSFDQGTIWFDLSAVDGISANLELVYGSHIDRIMAIPLFQSLGENQVEEVLFLK